MSDSKDWLHCIYNNTYSGEITAIVVVSYFNISPSVFKHARGIQMLGSHDTCPYILRYEIWSQYSILGVQIRYFNPLVVSTRYNFSILARVLSVPLWDHRSLGLYGSTANNYYLNLTDVITASITAENSNLQNGL